MFVIHMEHAPDSIRGIMSLYAAEVAPFMFVSTASAKIRDELWNKIIEIEEISAILLYSDKNEQGYTTKIFGYPSYSINDFDGIKLIEKPANFLVKDIAEKLWAKTNITDKENRIQKPDKSLIDHMLETGIVSESLINIVFCRLIHILSDISGIEISKLKKQIVFICAIHDIGKSHPLFQKKCNETYNILDAHNLMQQSIESIEKGFRHEMYGEDLLYDLLKNDVHDYKMIDVIAKTVGLHHQKHIQRKYEHQAIAISSDIRGRWLDIQKYIYNYINEVFPVQDIKFNRTMSPEEKFIFSSGVLGIVITSDWIASNTDKNAAFSRFDNDYNKTYHDFSTKQKYLEYKKNHVLAFLAQERLTTEKYPTPENFSSMFNLPVPRPVQLDVANIVENNEVSMLLIESGCGSGKTEAALYASAVLGNKNNLSGLYMGLPTGASAEAIQGRVNDFVDSLHMDKTKLYTSKSMLFHDSEDEQDWTDISTRRMLSHSAVGTIDQVMTVARNVRFESVRLAGISSKVIIIDELHAYDSFMIMTIVSLLKICKVLKIPVILLSATLPIKTKKMILSKVYGIDDVNVNYGYPLISYVTLNNTYHEFVSTAYDSDKNIRCELLPALNNHTQIASTAIKNIENGGCECVIMNLVDDAISIYDEIKKLKPDDCEILLYHARMPMAMRDEKTKKILKMVGKDKSNRPQKLIIVSTQILEQSLDIDFDYMMTAIAPIDLIIQRIGRYRRHCDEGTIREKQNIDYLVQVIVPDNGNYGKNTRIYEECFLSATENELMHRGNLIIPSGNPEIINAVYSQQDFDSILNDKHKENKSNNGNIDISNGFTIYDDVCKALVSDDYISVRDTEINSVDIAIMDKREIESLKENKKNIELYKKSVVSLPIYKIVDIKDSAERARGIFKDVYIFEQDLDYDGTKLSLDNEYGLKIETNEI